MCQEGYNGYQQQQYYNQDYEYTQHQQKLLDRSYETSFNNPSGSYYQQPYQEEEEEVYAPQPFTYEYGGADSYGRHFAKTESKDEAGVVKGKYNLTTY